MEEGKALTLEQFLELYPWPSERVTARPVDWLWHFDLPCEPEEIWLHLIDTSRLNRALGLAEMKFEERDGVLHGSSRVAGVPHEWVEVPWTWVWCRELVAQRIYSRGFATYLRAIHRLSPAGPGRSALSVYVGLIPRNLPGRAAIALAGRGVAHGYRRLMPELAREAKIERPAPYRAAPPLLSPAARTRLAELRGLLLDQGVHADALQALIGVIEGGEDAEAYRIQVKRLAREVGIAETDLLVACLYATRAGMLELSWDVVCPHCRGVREGLTTLSEVTKRGRCDVCEIDFDTASEHAIEITFRIHASIRHVPEILYCSAEPAKKKHIRAQLQVPPGHRIVETDFEPGLYRLRVRGNPHQSAIDIVPGGEPKLEWHAETGDEHLRAGPHPQLQLHNDGSQTLAVTIEQATWADTALRPSDVFRLQQFRDLFSEEYLGADVQLHVGEQTLVFTDMVGSTRFYAERGDPAAFVEVKRHFGVIQDVLRARGGAFVKSIGDAVMMVFSNPLEAVQTTREILRQFPARSGDAVRLRASIHTGPCIAVNLNAAIDYFGGTVNIAAKLQKVAGAGDIAMSSAVLSGPGVKDYLDSSAAVLIAGTLDSDAGKIAHAVWKTDAPIPRARGTEADPGTRDLIR